MRQDAAGADGSGYVAGGANCATSSKVCNQTSTCSATTTDTIASALNTYSVSTELVGNAVTTRTARTLTKIEQYLTVTGTSVFTWVVYEGSSSTGTLTKIFETTTSGTASASFVSSPVISVPLKSSMTYVIGVVVNGSFSYWYGDGTYPQNISFGQVLGGSLYYASTVPATVSFSGFAGPTYQRLTTAP